MMRFTISFFAKRAPNTLPPLKVDGHQLPIRVTGGFVCGSMIVCQNLSAG
jgi:hypothetical protein